MKRAVITGLGIVSPLGNNLTETFTSLYETRSGIKFQDAYAEMGLRSHIAGSIDIDVATMHPSIIILPFSLALSAINNASDRPPVLSSLILIAPYFFDTSSKSEIE